MEQQVQIALEIAKNLEVRGCVTGSAMLGYFEGQDIDVFVYDEANFTKAIFSLYHHPDFQVLDKLEKWKLENFMDTGYNVSRKLGLATIKFTYNTCVDVNVIFKKNSTNIMSVLSSFDMDIIAKGYDIYTKEYLDLTYGSQESKIANPNRWNIAFKDVTMWGVSRVLRQFERCVKYHKRGYNTDNVVLKYLELIDSLMEYESVFYSESFNEKLKNTKEQVSYLKKLFQAWLQDHKFTDDQLKALQQLILELPKTTAQ